MFILYSSIGLILMLSLFHTPLLYYVYLVFIYWININVKLVSYSPVVLCLFYIYVLFSNIFPVELRLFLSYLLDIIKHKS
jgi:hypothetical protein